MPAQGVKTVAIARNGVGAFLLPCRRLDLHYCDWAGSSRGMNAFLGSPLLSSLTAAYPGVEFRISPRPHRHPVLRAYYINGREKAVCVRNLAKEQILGKARLLLGNDGTKNKRLGSRKVVSSAEEAVRGAWSALHGGIKDV
ncbi:hypothetical protein DV736_g3388, partial [Chaetothyriales sp. CBS 134916]